MLCVHWACWKERLSHYLQFPGQYNKWVMYHEILWAMRKGFFSFLAGYFYVI